MKLDSTDAKIVVSNDLDEYTILNLKAQGAKVDVGELERNSLRRTINLHLEQYIKLFPLKMMQVKWKIRSKFLQQLKK